VIARVVGEAMRAELGQPVIIENRAGAGGSLGTAAIAKATPDGYTIGMGTASTLAINPAAYKNSPFDVQKDLTPIGNIAVVPNIMSINASVAAADMKAFTALARTQARAANSLMARRQRQRQPSDGRAYKLGTKTDLVHVPYRGIGPALQDVVGGRSRFCSTICRPLCRCRGRQAGARSRIGTKAPRCAAGRADFAKWARRSHWMGFSADRAAGTPQPSLQNSMPR